MNKSNIRAFFAIDLPHAINPLIADILKQLQHSYKNKSIHWVKPEHLHVTLQFIEAINNDDIAPLIERVRATIKSIQPFSIKLTTLELFPTRFRPHIISINMTPNEKLAALAQSIGQSIISCGYPIETRPYRGHLTLGRIKDDRISVELEKIAVPVFPDLLVNEVILYQSELTREGPSYLPLAKIALS